jgi:ABC-type cobalamin transport system ATPase subunit
MTQMNLPRVRKVTLRSFSLYSSKPIIEESFAGGVFCLAGANGLGKSTFLTAVNYGITGIVADPNREFKSVEEYYRHSLEFSSEFFTGRIKEPDREAAEVSLELLVDKYVFRLTRGMFEPDQLRSFDVIEQAPPNAIILNTLDLSASQRQGVYAQRLTEQVGLDSFEQLVFLQHFVFTFDERRHLLFWNQKVLEQTLYLAFGVDTVDAKRADTLRREIERAASLARNFNWQATETQKKMADLQNRLEVVIESQPSINDVVSQHKFLLDEYEQLKSKADKLESNLGDINLKIADISSQQYVLRTQYAEDFSRYIHGKHDLLHHALIASSIADAKCGLCGAEGKEIAKVIKERASSEICPLCGSGIVKTGKLARGEHIKQLEAVDKNLSKNKDKLDELVRSRERIKSSLESLKDNLATTKSQLDDFEQAHADTLAHLRNLANLPDNLDAILSTYRTQLEEFQHRKKESYNRRDEKQKELRKLQLKLENQYREAESEFVPLFKDLAFSFLGIDLDIRMDKQPSSGLTLVLEVRDTPRRQHHELSESQRFFVDIALRMALAQYISADSSKATLFVDTPEGSLDIAYESRAGDMFARFIENGYHIFMTANINSSRMLRSLAERCGRPKMVLHRMTSWTELSAVQIEEDGLFKEAYRQIEQALRSAKKARND